MYCLQKWQLLRHELIVSRLQLAAQKRVQGWRRHTMSTSQRLSPWLVDHKDYWKYQAKLQYATDDTEDRSLGALWIYLLIQPLLNRPGKHVYGGQLNYMLKSSWQKRSHQQLRGLRTIWVDTSRSSSCHIMALQIACNNELNVLCSAYGNLPYMVINQPQHTLNFHATSQ